MTTKKSSIRYRLTIWNTALLAVIMLSFLTILNVSIQTFLKSDIDKRLRNSSERYLGIVSSPSGARYRYMKSPKFSRNHALPGMYFNKDGAVIHSMGGGELNHPLERKAFKKAVSGEETFSTADYKGHRYRVHYIPVLQGDSTKITGVIQMAQSIAEYEALFQSLTMALTALIPITIILAGIGGFFITNGMLTPLKAMVTAAENINDEDLSKRLPVIGTDEFAQLSSTINGMLERIDRSFTYLKQAFAREQQFSSDASHELRTPLTVIQAGASLALRAEREPEYYKKVLTEIEYSANSMSSIIQDLLMMAKSENGTIALNYETFPSMELFMDAVDMLAPAISEKMTEINIETNAAEIYGDKNYLRRMIVNFLHNAIRHTEEKGKITLKSIIDGDETVLTVEDNGEGIETEHIPNLMKRFYRVDQARDRKSGGSGLGLAICKSIADLHGGEIKIDSTPGKGTKITVRLRNKPAS